jgi:RNA polymerase sporulation-specific sigma factor
MSAYSAAPSPSDVAHLAQQHFPLVVHIAKRFVRSSVPLDDLVGEGSIGLIRGLQTYDPARGPLGAHLAVCIKQAIIASLRRWRPWHPLPVDTDGEDQPIEDQRGETPCVSVEEDDERALVQRMLLTLHPADRQFVEMHYLRGMATSEIAQAIGVSRGRVRQRLARALKRMRTAAGQDEAGVALPVGDRAAS